MPTVLQMPLNLRNEQHKKIYETMTEALESGLYDSEAAWLRDMVLRGMEASQAEQPAVDAAQLERNQNTITAALKLILEKVRGLEKKIEDKTIVDLPQGDDSGPPPSKMDKLVDMDLDDFG